MAVGFHRGGEIRMERRKAQSLLYQKDQRPGLYGGGKHNQGAKYLSGGVWICEIARAVGSWKINDPDFITGGDHQWRGEGERERSEPDVMCDGRCDRKRSVECNGRPMWGMDGPDFIGGSAISETQNLEA